MMENWGCPKTTSDLCPLAICLTQNEIKNICFCFCFFFIYLFIFLSVSLFFFFFKILWRRAWMIFSAWQQTPFCCHPSQWNIVRRQYTVRDQRKETLSLQTSRRPTSAFSSPPCRSSLVNTKLSLGFLPVRSIYLSASLLPSSHVEKLESWKVERLMVSLTIQFSFLGNQPKKAEYRRTSSYPYPYPYAHIKLQEDQEGRNTSLGELCCKPYLMKNYLFLGTSVDARNCNIIREIWNLAKGLDSRIVKHSLIANSPENHEAGMTLLFQMKYFSTKQYRPWQTKLTLLPKIK